jgi:hypothetical protein
VVLNLSYKSFFEGYKVRLDLVSLSLKRKLLRITLKTQMFREAEGLEHPGSW